MEKRPKTASIESFSLAERVDRAYATALGQHESYASISEEELKGFIKEILLEIDSLETVAERDRVPSRSLPPEFARDIGAVWTFSGPGTYDHPVKNDRYKNYPWAAGMDRARLNYTDQIARFIAESNTGVSLKGPLSSLAERKEKTKEAIRAAGPTIIYNGTKVENDTVKDVLTREGIIIPAERVSTIREGIDTTVDQIKGFVLPEHALEVEKMLALVSHAPHLSRIVRILNRYKPLPEGTKVILLPLPTPAEGKEEYARMETVGILYYMYLSKTHDATRDSYPYTVHSAS